ncbi:DUF5719 family protein [Marisediminicola senii]|uniref:DUF5719 family protein n=1 Tax=Marisediminicola senii TaxID=2711233 RepID=UPI0013EC38D3|nr:DUF5719 family protein [Marisediminicola senii]
MTDRDDTTPVNPTPADATPGTGAPGTGAPGTGAPGTGAPDTGAPGTAPSGTVPPGASTPNRSAPAHAASFDADYSDSQTAPEPTGSEYDEPSSLESVHVRDDVPEPPRRPSRSTVISVGARGLAGVVGLAIAVVAIAGATVVELPSYRITPPSVLVSPTAAEQQRVCPGPLLRLGNADQGASAVTSDGQAQVAFTAEPGDATASDLPTTENTAGVAPLVLTLPPVGGTAASPESALPADPDAALDIDPTLTGSQSQAIQSTDLTGFAAAECAEASAESWLVGGSTITGRTTLVSVTNPTTVIATVAMTIYGEDGIVAAPGAEGVVVEPGEQRIFSLAGFAGTIESPVVRVQSRGGLVVASLVQETVRGLQTGGVDIVGTSEAASTTTVIPGVVIDTADRVAAAQSTDGYTDLQPTIRVVAPDTAEATLEVTVTPEQAGGEDAATSFEVDVEPGEVTELPLQGVADGRYSVSIVSTSPVVAGVRVSTVTEAGPNDFAWLPSTRALGERALVSVAPGPSPRLSLANTGGADATVEVVASGAQDGDATGETDKTVTVPAGGTASIEVAAGSDLVLTGAEGLGATVTYLGDGQLSSFRVTPPGPASRDITIYP